MSTNSQQNIGNAPAEEPKDWTIMLYITADGTLANFAVESLKQLNEAVSTPPEEGDASVIVAAHFSFPGDGSNPGDTTNPVSARAQAPGNETPPEYIFEAPKSAPASSSQAMRSRPVARGEVLTLPPSITVSRQAGTPPEANMPGQASNPGQANMSEKEALKAFLDGVYSNERLKSKHYALILWGHGPELLLQPPAGNSTGDSNSLYLTPEELREVLTECTPPTKDSKLDIIGFDACFMSMFEMADELKELAHYMVASQDEVPDQSFPYACLVELFRENGKNDLNSLLSKGVQAYVNTYQDCISNGTTDMNPVTLSALNLNNCHALNKAVKGLADALVRAKNEPELQSTLIQAREESQDYAGGLYVDLYGFCQNLNEELRKLKKRQLEQIEKLDKLIEKEHLEWKKERLDESKNKTHRELDKTATWIKGIGGKCQSVKTALEISDRGDSLVLVNGSVEISEDGTNGKAQVNGSEIPEDDENAKASLPKEVKNHGISIYLPYLTDEQYAQVQRPLVKGTPGSHSGKGFGDVLNGAGSEYLMCVRRDLILDTESYYPDLKLDDETHWYDFITEVWTRALMRKVPADLDYHYSAQQSWMNVSRDLETKIADLGKSEKST